jgi:uroporphyrinogen decarboxylase
MTSRERVLTAVAHQQPDRVPVFANISRSHAQVLAGELRSELSMQLDARTGNPDEPLPCFVADRVSYTEILLALGNDAVAVGPGRRPPKPASRQSKAAGGVPDKYIDLTDEWGLTSRKVGYHIEIIGRPLTEAATIDHIESWHPPDPTEPWRWDIAKKEIDKYKRAYVVIGFTGVNAFETAWNLTGFEKFLMDFMTGEAYTTLLLDKLFDFSLKSGLKLIDLGVDFIWLGDDVGTQDGMLLPPDFWREHLKPRMAALIAEFKKRDPDVKIIYHSCGSILPIIPDLIEIGLDVLNPIQPLAKGMSLKAIKEDYGDKLSFLGGVDIQQILPMGSEQEIADHIRDRIAAGSGNGGYIIAPAHIIQPDTSVENVKAFFTYALRFG